MENEQLELRFSMGNGRRVFTASNDGEIVRVAIQDGEKRHEWFYLDKWEVAKLRKMLDAFAAENPVFEEQPVSASTNEGKQ